MRVAASNGAVTACFEDNYHRTAPSFDNAGSHAIRLRDRNLYLYWSRGEIVQKRAAQSQCFKDLVKSHLYTRRDISVGLRDQFGPQFVIGLPGMIDAQIASYARRAPDQSNCAKPLGQLVC